MKNLIHINMTHLSSLLGKILAVVADWVRESAKWEEYHSSEVLEEESDRILD